MPHELRLSPVGYIYIRVDAVDDVASLDANPDAASGYIRVDAVDANPKRAVLNSSVGVTKRKSHPSSQSLDKTSSQNPEESKSWSIDFPDHPQLSAATE